MSEKEYKYIKMISHTDELTVFKLLRDVTMEILPLVQKEFREETKSIQIDNMVFDCSLAVKADTACVAAMIDMLRIMKKNHVRGRVTLVHLSDKVESLLSVTKVSPFFEIYPTQEAAIAALSKS